MAINLQKGQKISLSKESGGTLSKVVMGLGWDAKQSGGGMLKGMFGGGGSSSAIDLDASCVLFNDQNKVLDTVYFGQLKAAMAVSCIRVITALAMVMEMMNKLLLIWIKFPRPLKPWYLR